MTLPTDGEIAAASQMKPILEVSETSGLEASELELYGTYKAKIRLDIMSRLPPQKNSRLILVSAMTPTPGGEGKTTVSIGLAQALHKLGQKTMVALREPSLGPVF